MRVCRATHNLEGERLALRDLHSKSIHKMSIYCAVRQIIADSASTVLVSTSCKLASGGWASNNQHSSAKVVHLWIVAEITSHQKICQSKNYRCLNWASYTSGSIHFPWQRKTFQGRKSCPCTFAARFGKILRKNSWMLKILWHRVSYCAFLTSHVSIAWCCNALLQVFFWGLSLVK